MARILIIDDDAQHREIIKLRIQKAGFEAEEAVNGEEGLRKALEGVPDLIILDVMMPKMDGWQVCRKLKGEEKTKRVPVLILTARSQQIEELRSWEAGADDYLTKPFDHKALIEKINKYIPQKGETKRVVFKDVRQQHPRFL